MIEFELRIPVARWLLKRGLHPILEVSCLGNCDLIGAAFQTKPIKLTEIVAVELKLSDITGVLRQCRSHVNRGIGEVWAALPLEVALRKKDSFDSDIGLLSVDVTSGEVYEIVPATIRTTKRNIINYSQNALKRRRNEYKWRLNNPNGYRFPEPCRTKP
jgi:hypothetical protein